MLLNALVLIANLPVPMPDTFREEALGPVLVETQTMTLYRECEIPSVRTQDGVITAAGIQTDTLGRYEYEVRDGAFAETPCLIIRRRMTRYAERPADTPPAVRQQWFYVSAEGDLLRQYERIDGLDGPGEANVTVSPNRLDVTVSDAHGRRAFDREIPDPEAFRSRFRPLVSGVKKYAVYDPFRNEFTPGEVYRRGSINLPGSATASAGESYANAVGEVMYIAQGRVLRVMYSNEVFLRSDIRREGS